MSRSNHIPAPRLDARRGFTLVELLIVIAIISVMAAAAVPRYSRAVSRQQAEAAAKRVAADLAEARQAARGSSASVSVTFNAAASTYTISYPATGGVTASTRTVDLTRPPLSAKLVSATFGSPATTTVTFNGHGVSSSAGTIRVSAGTTVKTITAPASVGPATIQ